MSMFHELMMRKKEETMYAIIQGSPTQSPYGIFSGFSSENYLSLPNFAPTGNWEVLVKIRTGNTLVDPVRYFFGSFGSSGNVVVGTTTGNKFKAFISTNNGSSFNVQLVTTQTILTQTDYYVRVGFTGAKYYLDFSFDGINYIGRAEYSSIEEISSYPTYFGRVFAVNNLWNGSIDLNKSYIKIGNTKYKLQAVVGYTVVGSPTITDGVASGFSASNYLEMQQNIKPTQSFEVKTKFNKTSSSPTNGIFSSRQSSSITSAGRFGIGLTCGNYLNFFVSFDGTSWGFDVTDSSYFIENNISYFVKFGWTGKEYYVLISTDDINYVKIISHLSTIPPTSNIEYTTLGLYASTDRRFLSGNLYLNETYIKINNKLWFNGQQA